MAGLYSFIGHEDFPIEKGSHPDQTMAEKARAVVWQLMHEAVQANPSRATTLADLSALVTRSAARILGMDEDDLVRLLRDHPPH